MANIIPFEGANVPAFLTEAESANDLAGYASQSFPLISIKGKVFTLVKGDERIILKNPKDPEAPATNIVVAMVKASPNKSKTYYANGYQENVEDNKPTCFSNNGRTPDPSVAEPQCKTCAACRFNVFGTARGENGMGKGKACSDFVRLVVSPVDDLESVFLLRVPPASIKNLGEYGANLSKRKVPYQGVVTKISFDAAQATPKLVFTAVGYLDQDSFSRVMELSKSEQVSRMINGSTPEMAQDETVVAPPATKKPTKQQEMVDESAEKIVKAIVGEAPKKPEPKPEPVVVEDGSLASAFASLNMDE